MRIGRFPGQQEALREEVARRMRRRTFVAGLAGLVIGTVTGGLIGWHLPARPRHPQLEFARALSRGPWRDLEAQYSVVLDVIDLTGGDPVLWAGARRLAEHVLRTRGGRASRIARALYRTVSHGRAPSDLKALQEALADKGGIDLERERGK